MTAKSRISKEAQARKRRANFDETYKDAMKYTAQHRETFDYHQPGEKKYDRIFDSTGQNALMKFASNVQSGICPTFKKWIKFTPGAEIVPDKVEEAQRQLDLVTDTFFKYLHSSNFDTQISESFIDLGFGTGVLLLNEGDDSSPFNFVAVPLAEVSFLEGPFGRIQDVFRRFKMKRSNIKATWPDAKEPSPALGADEEDEDIEILESTIYDHDKGTYSYCVDEIKGEANLYEEEMPVSPWIVFRWSAMPGEIYGRGPVLHCMADIKTLNKTTEILLQSAALKSIHTFMAADDGVINPHNIEINVGMIIPTAPWGPGGPPIRALEVGGDVNLTQFVMEKIQRRIEDMMFTNPLGDVNLPVKTATEMSLRSQELANRIGSAFGRLHYELVGPLVNACLAILERRGLLPVSLKDVKVDGRVIKIHYMSPLAQAQDEEEVINAVRYVQTMAGIVGPQAVPLFVDLDEFSSLLGTNLGMKKLVPTKEKRAEIVGLITQLAQSGLMGGAGAPPAAPPA